MELVGVVMAGGGGTRFWPISRTNTPKQFLNLSGEDTLVNETLKRVASVIEKENIFIVTNENQGDALKRIVQGNCSQENILLEPASRNTAPCIGYAACKLAKDYGDAIMCVFPSDHYIKDHAAFGRAVMRAVDVADKSNRIVTIGIKPTFPSTGYGYVRFDPIEVQGTFEGSYPVNEFVEKPNFEKAKGYVQSGQYLWNSGMYVCKVSVMMESFQRFIPRIYNALQQIVSCVPGDAQKVSEIYSAIQSISIDYGIMERCDDLMVVEGDFGWNDVGSWDALGSICNTDENGNIVKGNNVTIDTKNCILYGNGRLIATIGLDHVIVVETEDAILVCPKNRAQEVKGMVEKLEQSGKAQYL